MKYEMSQAELQEAVQHYLNDKVLKRPVKVRTVEPRDNKNLGINYVLHVTVIDDQAHMQEVLDAAAA